MLLLICGIPNAGKTTYSKRYDNVIHLDDMVGSNKFGQCNRIASAADGDAVVEGVYITKHRRKELLEACADKSPKICVWLDAPLEECIRRERNYRKRPAFVVTSNHEMSQIPSLDEGWDKTVIVNSYSRKENK